MRVSQAIVLSLIVAFAAATFDIYFHFFLGAEIHLPYVSIKTIVIFAAMFLVSRWTGFGLNRGLAVAAIASIMFYIYYRFTEPTLDRTVFKLDEDTLFILIHFVGIYLFYFLLTKAVKTHDA